VAGVVEGDVCLTGSVNPVGWRKVTGGRRLGKLIAGGKGGVSACAVALDPVPVLLGTVAPEPDTGNRGCVFEDGVAV